MDGVSGLYSVLLYVRDLQTSLAFYRDRLGLNQLGPADGSVAILHAGGCQVVLHRADRADWPAPGTNLTPGGHALTFQVDDPDVWARSGLPGNASKSSQDPSIRSGVGSSL